MSDAPADEIERAEGILEDRWHVTEPLGYDLDDLFAEDDAAIDFAAEPRPLDGLDQIDRRFATLARAERKLAEYDATANERRAELEHRIEQGRRTLVERVGYYTRSLQLSHQAIIDTDPTRTRITVPNGTLTSKAGGVEWVWPAPDTPEEGELVAWVREHCSSAYVAPSNVPVPARVAKLPLKGELKAAATTKRNGVTVPLSEDGTVRVDGVPVPGVRVVAKSRTFLPQTAGIEGF